MCEDARIAALEQRVEHLEGLLFQKGHPKSRWSVELNPNDIMGRHGASMNKTEAANELGVTRATIYKMLEDGRLSLSMDGKVNTQSVYEYAELKRRVSTKRKACPG